MFEIQEYFNLMQRKQASQREIMKGILSNKHLLMAYKIQYPSENIDYWPTYFLIMDNMPVVEVTFDQKRRFHIYYKGQTPFDVTPEMEQKSPEFDAILIEGLASNNWKYRQKIPFLLASRAKISDFLKIFKALENIYLKDKSKSVKLEAILAMEDMLNNSYNSLHPETKGKILHTIILHIPKVTRLGYSARILAIHSSLEESHLESIIETLAKINFTLKKTMKHFFVKMEYWDTFSVLRGTENKETSIAILQNKIALARYPEKYKMMLNVVLPKEILFSEGFQRE